MYDYLDESGCGVMDWDQFLFTHNHYWEEDYEDAEESEIIKDDFFDEK